MSAWSFYFVTEPKAVRLEDIEGALQAVNPDFYVDADLVILRGGYGGGELECAQITIEDAPDAAALRAEFAPPLEGKRGRARLEAALDGTQTLVVIQLINVDLWWDNEPERTLAPLQQWLVQNFSGVLRVEGGEFYDRRGRIR